MQKGHVGQTHFKYSNQKPHRFQKEVWGHIAEGKSGLLHAPTGRGKTHAVWLGILDVLANQPNSNQKAFTNLQCLWITPLRALAKSSMAALSETASLHSNLSVEIRTGETSHHRRKKQNANCPNILITTPESLSLLLMDPIWRDRFEKLTHVVVDEWHEFLHSKRGIHLELLLAHLRFMQQKKRKKICFWGMSATFSNIDQALKRLTGHRLSSAFVVVSDLTKPKLRIRTLTPKVKEKYTWRGHLGLHMLADVIAEIKAKKVVIVFTNTRAQAERWHLALSLAMPDFEGKLALHHGSLSKKERDAVEKKLLTSDLRCVVSTSSLDLGVDFPAVDLVIQIASPKSVSRFIQRAGRSGHGPFQTSEILGVPTQALELLEFAALREAVKAGVREEPEPLGMPEDILAQHIVTLCYSSPQTFEDIFKQVKSTFTYSKLQKEHFDKVFNFVQNGGKSMEAYEKYHRIKKNSDGLWIGQGQSHKQLHKLSIGTIVGEDSLQIRLRKSMRGMGQYIGTIDESFVNRMSAGDQFVFGGKSLEFQAISNGQVFVQHPSSRKKNSRVATWGGGHLLLSSRLRNGLNELLTEAVSGRYVNAEMKALKPLLEAQRRLSSLPKKSQLLVEVMNVDQDFFCFLYPFAGRALHETLSAFLCQSLVDDSRVSVSAVSSEHGILLHGYGKQMSGFDWEGFLLAALNKDKFYGTIYETVDAQSMIERSFRHVARIGGLTFQPPPGSKSTGRSLRAASGLVYQVLRRFDRKHVLLAQAEREALKDDGHLARVAELVEELSIRQTHRVDIKTLSPFAFPLWSEGSAFSLSMTSESTKEKVMRMLETQKEFDSSNVRGKLD